MKITTSQLIQIIADHGDEWGISIAPVAKLGFDRVLDGIEAQLNAVTLDEHTDPVRAVQDYFCDGAFDHAFDVAFANGEIDI